MSEQSPAAASGPATSQMRRLAVRRNNVETVRAVFQALTERDVRGALEVADRTVEFYAPATAALTRGGRSYRGYEGIFSYFRDVSSVWDELEFTPQEFRELDDEVLVFGRLRARAFSGLLIDEPAQWVFKLRNAKVLWASAFETKLAALESVGLSA